MVTTYRDSLLTGGTKMKELIKIKTDSKGRKYVSGRELHKTLEVEQDFEIWIEERVREYNFERKVSFIVVPKLKDAHMRVDMAKELAVIEKSKKGKEVIQYFVDFERGGKMELEVIKVDGKLVVSSRSVAKNFGKRHHHVIDSLEKILANPSIVGLIIPQ